MRFMTMVRCAENPAPPPQALVDAMAMESQEGPRAGIVIEMGGLAPSAMSTRVRLAGGKVAVTDGPFTEAKEVIGGYAVLQTRSREEAVEAAVWLMNLHREHWPGWEGEVEVRQILGPEDLFPEPAHP